MAEGREAADEIKGVFKGIHDAGEETRKETNSFFDELLAPKNGTTKEHQSTGVSKDAKAVGNAIDKGLTSASAKATETKGEAKSANA